MGGNDMETLVKKGDSGWGQGQAVTGSSLKNLKGFSSCCRVKVAGLIKGFCPLCLATEVLGMFVPLRLFF